MPVEIATRSEIGIPAKADTLGINVQSDVKEFSAKNLKPVVNAPCPGAPCAPGRPCAPVPIPPRPLPCR